MHFSQAFIFNAVCQVPRVAFMCDVPLHRGHVQGVAVYLLGQTRKPALEENLRVLCGRNAPISVHWETPRRRSSGQEASQPDFSEMGVAFARSR